MKTTILVKVKMKKSFVPGSTILSHLYFNLRPIFSALGFSLSHLSALKFFFFFMKTV